MLPACCVNIQWAIAYSRVVARRGAQHHSSSVAQPRVREVITSSAHDRELNPTRSDCGLQNLIIIINRVFE